nr:hypothetical protein [Thermotogota bacterium]
KWDDFKRSFDAVSFNHSTESEVKFALEFLTGISYWENFRNQETVDRAFQDAILGRYKAVLTDLNEVREHLSKRTRVSPYDWSGHPDVNWLIQELAQKKYSQEPFQRVIRRIDSMDSDKLKEYLKRLVEGNMTVGIEILEDGGVGS